jgi:hypothetical protein
MSYTPSAVALTGLLLLASGARSAPVVAVRRADAPDPKIKSWFATLDRLVKRADAAQTRLGVAAARPASRDALDAVEAVEALAKDYASLTGDKKGGAEAAAFASGVRESLKGASPTDPLSKDARESVFPLESPSLNRWIELIRQQALAMPGPEARASANALASIEEDGSVLAEAAFLEISPSAALSPGVRALVAAAPERLDPALSAVVSGSKVWLSKEKASFYGDFSSGSGQGLLRLRVESPGGAALEQSRFYFLTRALYELGFAVSVDNGVLTALLSGERAPLDLDARVERFGAAWKAFETAEALAPKLERYLAGTVSQDQNAERLDRLARIFRANGRLPMLPLDDLLTAVEAYRRNTDERESLRGELSNGLERLGLGAFPPGAPVGQRTIDLYYNTPVRAAVARGELVLDGKAFRRSPRYRPLAGLSTADPRHERYDWSGLFAAGRPIGRVAGALAFRAQWRLDAEEWLIVRYTRGLSDGRLKALRAEGLSFDALVAKLSALGLIRPKVEPRVREAFGRRGRPDPTREAFGATLAPGSSVLARVTYDRSKAELGGRIFATPYIAFGDRKAVRRARGLLTTSGGAQAAIVAGLAGVPAVDIPAGMWDETSGLSIDLPVFAKSGTVKSFKRVVVREGEAVRLDPGRGVVSFPEPETQSWLVAMEEALTAYDRGADINALALWASGRLATLSASARDDVGRLLIEELEARQKTGVSPEHVERIRRVVTERR